MSEKRYIKVYLNDDDLERFSEYSDFVGASQSSMVGELVKMEMKEWRLLKEKPAVLRKQKGYRRKK